MKKTHVILHHSATADSGTLSVSAIRRYHKEKGWRDIGYHLICELVRDTRGVPEFEVILGRGLHEDGAHCRENGMNRRALGLCFVGNFDETEPDPGMLQAGARQLAQIMRALEIPYDREHVKMHREYAPYKSCPGKRFPIDSFVAMLEGV